MRQAYAARGLSSDVLVGRVDRAGARVIDDTGGAR
jgi:hypothetical protein